MSVQKLENYSLKDFQDSIELELEKLSEINYLLDPRTLQQEGADALLQLADLVKECGEEIVDAKFDVEVDVALDRLVDPLVAPLVAKVLIRLRDLQVRDFALGSITDDNLEIFLAMWRWIVRIAPSRYLAPVATLLAATYYESREPDLAKSALAQALDIDREYPLALLLQRVFAADWPPETFARMRCELHPKVRAAIYG